MNPTVCVTAVIHLLTGTTFPVQRVGFASYPKMYIKVIRKVKDFKLNSTKLPISNMSNFFISIHSPIQIVDFNLFLANKGISPSNGCKGALKVQWIPARYCDRTVLPSNKSGHEISTWSGKCVGTPTLPHSGPPHELTESVGGCQRMLSERNQLRFLNFSSQSLQTSKINVDFRLAEEQWAEKTSMENPWLSSSIKAVHH